MKREPPTQDEENRLRSLGYRFIAGIDEAGRGALMGPVVAAAIIMPERVNGGWCNRVRDSKQLKPAERQSLSEVIRENAVSCGIGVMSHDIIDSIGIARATRQAMLAAVEELSREPDYLLIDYFKLPETRIPHHGITRGDCLCFSIACASIIAKVTRDRLVEELDSRYPGYRFSAHKGYGTAEHLRCLQQNGPSTVHRRTFMPVRAIIESK
ncbi:MAG: ribonuclease HII [Dehalococcoidales bacterium]|nr:ribonuclease HII [Dehalococcoidales bacterium]